MMMMMIIIILILILILSSILNPFPLILNPPNSPILNRPNIVQLCSKGEVFLLGGGGV